MLSAEREDRLMITNVNSRDRQQRLVLPNVNRRESKIRLMKNVNSRQITD